MHQGINNMLVVKNVDKKLFDYIYSWIETIASIEWSIIFSHFRNIGATPGKAVYDIDILFNITSVIKWQVILERKKQQVNIDHIHKNSNEVIFDYAIDNLL